MELPAASWGKYLALILFLFSALFFSHTNSLILVIFTLTFPFVFPPYLTAPLEDLKEFEAYSYRGVNAKVRHQGKVTSVQPPFSASNNGNTSGI